MEKFFVFSFLLEQASRAGGTLCRKINYIFNTMLHHGRGHRYDWNIGIPWRKLMRATGPLLSHSIHR